MDTYRACSIAEGFSGEEHSQEEQLEAWQFLIDTGAAWRLQGWYGRNAQALISAGHCRAPMPCPEAEQASRDVREGRAPL